MPCRTDMPRPLRSTALLPASWIASQSFARWGRQKTRRAEVGMSYCSCNLFEMRLRDHAASGIMRRGQHTQLRAVGEQVSQFVGTEPKNFLFAHLQRYRLSTGKVDQ